MRLVSNVGDNEPIISRYCHSDDLCNSNQTEKTVVIKSVRHHRIQNERDVLKRFQTRTNTLRPLIDEIEDPIDPPAIVLQHLDDDLLKAAAKHRLTRPEIKRVAKTILEALKVLHEDGYVHTGMGVIQVLVGYCVLREIPDIKPDNVLVNYGEGDTRFTSIQVADCGNTVPADSIHAKKSHMIGAPIWRSPEAHLEIGWGTPTDIWSFGAVVSAFSSLHPIISLTS